MTATATMTTVEAHRVLKADVAYDTTMRLPSPRPVGAIAERGSPDSRRDRMPAEANSAATWYGKRTFRIALVVDPPKKRPCLWLVRAQSAFQ